LSSLGTDLVNWIASSITNRPIAGSDSNTQRSQQESKIISDIPRPPMSDFLDIRATIPGYVSFRDPEEGMKLEMNHIGITFLRNFLIQITFIRRKSADSKFMQTNARRISR
jgi:hypothetical protein